MSARRRDQVFCRSALSQCGMIRYTPAMTKERLIKKYANRRLYDASISKHVTLEDIRDLIVRGEKIRVVEDKSGEDITRLILLQVIAEQEQFGKPILTTQLLESIIRYYGGPMQDFMARYLEQTVAAFMRQQESVQQQISQMLNSAPPPMNAMTELTRQNMELWNRMQEGMLAMLVAPRKPRSSGDPDGVGDANGEPTGAAPRQGNL
ncbi:MAG: polyhydroxyalkanoate synthesis repressor PhaR [Dongiaceae bacterium]